MIRRRKLMFYMVLFSIVLISLVAMTAAQFCELKSNCGLQDTGLFSLYSRNNSHISAYGNPLSTAGYDMCCRLPDLDVEIRDGCRSTQEYLISLSGEETQQYNQHAGDSVEYINDICLESEYLDGCYISDDCGTDDCILKIKEPTLYNSHVGSCDDDITYITKVCCNIEGLSETCGNGMIDPGETCDDGNLIDNDLCNNNCTFNDCIYCGDNIVDPDGADMLPGNSDDEECDDGNNFGDDFCTAECRWPNAGYFDIDREIIRTERIVMYNGKPIKVVIDTFEK